MTPSIIIDKINKLKPNAIDEKLIIDFVNDVEKEIAINIMELSDYSLASIENKTNELLAPEPYDGIYFDYVAAKIDYFNGDAELYSLSSRQFNNTMDDLKAFCIRKGLSPSLTQVRTDYY